MIPNRSIPTIARYLERYAEHEASSLPEFPVSPFDNIIVIPVYDETEQALEQFLNLSNARSNFFIWIFNAPESATGTPSYYRTRTLLRSFLVRLNATAVNDNCYLARVHERMQLLLVDRCEQLIPDKQGVGLARKIGADLALCLSYRQYLQTSQLIPWIYSTDADVTLPQGYAGLAELDSDVSACIYPFEHQLEVGYKQAMRLYEFSLHYYVDQLAQAGSPYAFHTIGSLLAFTPLSYAQVRGFPRRSGAEDFYLLNKLAKVGRVETLDEPLIQVAGRPSQRVPFGTGPALIKINTQVAQDQPFQLYHPRIFTLLRALLNAVATIENSVSRSPLSLFESSDTILHAQEKQVLINTLNKLGWQKQWLHLQHKARSQDRQAAFHIWFDAFLTLRFVHELRDHLYPNIDLVELPALLDAVAYSGALIDYLAWFRKLGISA